MCHESPSWYPKNEGEKFFPRFMWSVPRTYIMPLPLPASPPTATVPLEISWLVLAMALYLQHLDACCNCPHSIATPLRHLSSNPSSDNYWLQCRPPLPNVNPTYKWLLPIIVVYMYHQLAFAFYIPPTHIIILCITTIHEKTHKKFCVMKRLRVSLIIGKPILSNIGM